MTPKFEGASFFLFTESASRKARDIVKFEAQEKQQYHITYEAYCASNNNGFSVAQ